MGVGVGGRGVIEGFEYEFSCGCDGLVDGRRPRGRARRRRVFCQFVDVNGLGPGLLRN